MKSKQVQMLNAKLRSIYTYLGWTIATLFIYGTALASPLPKPGGRPIYHVEFLTFKYGDSNTRLEVYAEIPLESLDFSFKGYAFLSRYEISLELFDLSGKLAHKTVLRDSVKLVSTSHIYDLQPILIRFDLNLPAGDYRAVVRMNDLESSQDSKIEVPVKIPDYGKPGLKVSDLQLSDSITHNKLVRDCSRHS